MRVRFELSNSRRWWKQGHWRISILCFVFGQEGYYADTKYEFRKFWVELAFLWYHLLIHIYTRNGKE